MDKKKHKRIDENIMKPEDLKKSRMSRVVGLSQSGSTSSGGGIKSKLDFRSSGSVSKTVVANNAASTSSSQNNSMRPVLDDKWKEFGDTINLNIETFTKSIKEAIEMDKFNKIARMIVAALKHFIINDRIKIEYRLLGTIAQTIKNHGMKLNHVPIHRGLLYIISNSRSFPENVLEMFVSLITTLAKLHNVIDKCYIIAFLHDAIGTNVGLGTVNRCCWIDKPFSQELVHLILRPFSTIFPRSEVYAACQLENFAPPDYLSLMSLPEGTPLSQESKVQLGVFVEFLKPWFDNIRGELIPKSLFRTLGILCGCEQIRYFIATRLEVWITLQKFHREISEILLILGCNLNAEKEIDREVVDILLKLNTKHMKTRTVMAPFNVAIRRACENSMNVRIIFESLVINEIGLTQNRSTVNLPTMHTLLAFQPVESTTTLAKCCARELIKDKENCMKLLRGFLKELIRSFNYTRNGEFPFSVFATEFLSSISTEIAINPSLIHDDLPRLACELLAQIPLFTISSLLQTRDNAFAAKYNSSMKSGEILVIPPDIQIIRKKFKTEFILYCEVVLKWLFSNKAIFNNDAVYTRCHYILLYADKHHEIYTSVECPAVNENELANCLRIFGECGISERMLLTLLGGSEGCRIASQHAMEIADFLTHRAAIHHPRNMEIPLVELSEPFMLIDAILMASTHTRDLVENEGISMICLKGVYWNAWNLILLWISAGKISELFEEIYNMCPILRYLIFVVMTRKFEFPLEFEGKTTEMLITSECELVEKEKMTLSIYEKKKMIPLNTLLMTSTLFAPKEEFRAPPYFDGIRVIADKYKLASKLARCTKPSLLSQLIENVGAQDSMPAIREMLTMDSQSVELLTPECLYYSIMYYSNLVIKNSADHQTNSILDSIMKQTLHNIKSADFSNENPLLEKLIESLSSPNISNRQSVIALFKRIFPSQSSVFCIDDVAKLPRFLNRQSDFLVGISAAVGAEKDTQLVTMYLCFLAKSFEKQSMHEVARLVFPAVFADRFELRNPFSEFLINYIDSCVELSKMEENIDDGMCCLDIGTSRIIVERLTPNTIIHLLSKYSNGETDNSFESLLELWLSPGTIPKIISNEHPEGICFTLEMKKDMLRSADARVVKAAICDLSEKDAESFMTVSQMSNETATMIIEKAQNMDLSCIELSELSNIYLIVKGYRLRGVKAGENLLNRVKNRLDEIRNQFATKEEPVFINEPIREFPSFLESEVKTDFGELLQCKTMDGNEISVWLKANCSQTASNQQKTVGEFRIPQSFIHSVISNEKSSTICLQHIEANLKYFLSNEPAFQILISIVDTASHKFPTVQRRLETLASRLLKSVVPPSSVRGVLKKHATRSSSNLQSNANNLSKNKIKTFTQIATLLKGSIIDKKKSIINEFVTSFVPVLNEKVDAEAIGTFLKAAWECTGPGPVEMVAEKCITSNWSPQFKQILCKSLLNSYDETIPSILPFRLIDSFCRMYTIASYRALFAEKQQSNGKVVMNRVAFHSLACYISNVASENEEYDMNIIDLLAIIEKEGGVICGFSIGEYLLFVSCSHRNYYLRNAALRLLNLLVDRLPYLSFRTGVSWSMRILTNIENRETCIRKCEQIVDRLIEINTDVNFGLMEDICEEERVNDKVGDLTKEENKRGEPPAKKGKWTAQGKNTETSPEEMVNRFNSTTAAIAQFSSMLREHPNIVKTKFPVLANFISQLTSMTKRDLRDENRIQKVELVLSSVVALCRHMKNEEFSSVETALTNCLEFYDKHVEEGLLAVKEQIGFAELLIRACAAYLKKNSIEARSILRDNRSIVDRACKRCRDKYDVELILDNIAAQDV